VEATVANGSTLDAFRLSGLAVLASSAEGSLSGYGYGESAVLAKQCADETEGTIEGQLAYRQLRYAQAAYSQTAADEHLQAFGETGDEEHLFAAVRWEMSAAEALQELAD
jgi:hypothetical protein